MFSRIVGLIKDRWANYRPWDKKKYTIDQTEVLESIQTCYKKCINVNLANTFFDVDENGKPKHDTTKFTAQFIEWHNKNSSLNHFVNGLLLLIYQYSDHRKDEWAQYPNDPTNLFCADFITWLQNTLSGGACNQDLLDNVKKRLDFLEMLLHNKVFPVADQTDDTYTREALLYNCVEQLKEVIKDIKFEMSRYTIAQHLDGVLNYTKNMIEFIFGCMVYWLCKEKVPISCALDNFYSPILSTELQKFKQELLTIQYLDKVVHSRALRDLFYVSNYTEIVPLQNSMPLQAPVSNQTHELIFLTDTGQGREDIICTLYINPISEDKKSMREVSTVSNQKTGISEFFAQDKDVISAYVQILGHMELLAEILLSIREAASLAQSGGEILMCKIAHHFLNYLMESYKKLMQSISENMKLIYSASNKMWRQLFAVKDSQHDKWKDNYHQAEKLYKLFNEAYKKSTKHSSEVTRTIEDIDEKTKKVMQRLQYFMFQVTQMANNVTWLVPNSEARQQIIAYQRESLFQISNETPWEFSLTTDHKLKIIKLLLSKVHEEQIQQLLLPALQVAFKEGDFYREDTDSVEFPVKSIRKECERVYQQVQTFAQKISRAKQVPENVLNAGEIAVLHWYLQYPNKVANIPEKEVKTTVESLGKIDSQIKELCLNKIKISLFLKSYLMSDLKQDYLFENITQEFKNFIQENFEFINQPVLPASNLRHIEQTRNQQAPKMAKLLTYSKDIFNVIKTLSITKPPIVVATVKTNKEITAMTIAADGTLFYATAATGIVFGDYAEIIRCQMDNKKSETIVSNLGDSVSDIVHYKSDIYFASGKKLEKKRYTDTGSESMFGSMNFKSQILFLIKLKKDQLSVVTGSRYLEFRPNRRNRNLPLGSGDIRNSYFSIIDLDKSEVKILERQFSKEDHQFFNDPTVTSEGGLVFESILTQYNDLSRLVCLLENQYIAYSDLGSSDISIFDPLKGKRIKVLAEEGNGKIQAMANYKTILVGSYSRYRPLENCKFQNYLCIWDLETYECIYTHKTDHETQFIAFDNHGYVYTRAYHKIQKLDFPELRQYFAKLDKDTASVKELPAEGIKASI